MLGTLEKRGYRYVEAWMGWGLTVCRFDSLTQRLDGLTKKANRKKRNRECSVCSYELLTRMHATADITRPVGASMIYGKNKRVPL